MKTETYCERCTDVTTHEDGRCTVCLGEEKLVVSYLTSEEIAWIRTKRKCLVAVTAVVCIIAINYGMAHRYDGDDIVRTILTGLATAIAAWFATSLRQEVNAVKKATGG